MLTCQTVIGLSPEKSYRCVKIVWLRVRCAETRQGGARKSIDTFEISLFSPASNTKTENSTFRLIEEPVYIYLKIKLLEMGKLIYFLFSLL